MLHSQPIPQIYFSFPDGVFDYVCAECNALCCRGQGFGGSLRREMGSLLTLYPSLESMVAKRRGDVLHFSNLRQGCQFLDEDRMCRIEREHGKALKPGVCSLFPFNSFSRMGEVLVVSPHFLCPLRLHSPAAPGKVAGTYSLIESAIAESGLVDERTWKLKVAAPARLRDRVDMSARLTREVRFRDRCGAALARLPFRSVLLAESVHPEQLTALTSRAAACLGLSILPPDGASDQIDDVLLAIAPAFRLRLFDLTDEAILLALGIGELLVREANQPSKVPLTPQSAINHLAAVSPILKLLAGTGPPRGMVEGRMKTPPFGQPRMTQAAQQFLAGLWAGQSRISAVEDGLANLPNRVDRVALLIDVGKAFL